MSLFDQDEPGQPAYIQAVFFAYDIPDASDIPNPSNELRPLAFRKQKSVWVMQEGDIPYDLVNRLRVAGAEVDIIRFDASEAPKLLAMAIKAVTRDIKETIASARRNAIAAEQRLDESEDGADESYTRYNTDRNRIIKTMGRNIRDLRVLAQRFHVADRIPTLSTAVSAVASLQVTMLQRAKAYADEVNALAVAMGEGNEVVRAGRRSAIPGGVLADYLDDNGLDGQTVRSRFFS